MSREISKDSGFTRKSVPHNYTVEQFDSQNYPAKLRFKIVQQTVLQSIVWAGKL